MAPPPLAFRIIMVGLGLPGLVYTAYFLMTNQLLDTPWFYCLALCALSALPGFRHFVYFFSYNYGMSLILTTVTIWLSYLSQIALGSELGLLFHGSAYVLYGGRLLVFLWRRESSKSHEARKKEIATKNASMPFPVKIVIFIFITILMAFYSFPFYFHIRAIASGHLDGMDSWGVAGGCVALAGLIVEIVADEQKQNFKDKHGDKFVNIGLYAITRHPNYMGEIIFHIGIYIGGLGAYLSSSHHALIAVAGVGQVAMVAVMLSQTRSLAAQQWEKYRQDPEFIAYVSRTPALFPFCPVFCLPAKSEDALLAKSDDAALAGADAGT
jgi:steroid 5-alpha reductase family enzyme